MFDFYSQAGSFDAISNSNGHATICIHIILDVLKINKLHTEKNKMFDIMKCNDYSQPWRFVAVQTDELNGSCSAGRGWRKNPMTRPERGPHRERTLSAEPDPEHRHRENELYWLSSFTHVRCGCAGICIFRRGHVSLPRWWREHKLRGKTAQCRQKSLL